MRFLAASQQRYFMSSSVTNEHRKQFLTIAFGGVAVFVALCAAAIIT